jgi:hypothetical protein
VRRRPVRTTTTRPTHPRIHAGWRATAVRAVGRRSRGSATIVRVAIVGVAVVVYLVGLEMRAPRDRASSSRRMAGRTTTQMDANDGSGHHRRGRSRRCSTSSRRPVDDEGDVAVDENSPPASGRKANPIWQRGQGFAVERRARLRAAARTPGPDRRRGNTVWRHRRPRLRYDAAIP